MAHGPHLDFALCLVIPFLIPFGFLFALAFLWGCAKALYAARDPDARNYWRCRLAAHLLFTYAVLVLSLLAVDSIFGEAGWLLARWPSLTGIWFDAGSSQVPVLLDIGVALGMALVALACASYFGRVDESKVWRPRRRPASRGRRAQDRC